MTEGFRLDADTGKFIVDDDGFGVHEDCCCGCTCECSLTSCLGSKMNGDNSVLRNLVAVSDKVIHTVLCGRLDIYECAYHDGSKFIVNDDCRTTVRTEVRSGGDFTVRRTAYDGPFLETSKTAGSQLTDAPFWWPLCGGSSPAGIGGWAVVEPWWTFASSEWEDFYTYADDIMTLPDTGDFFTLILYLSFRRPDARYTKAGGGQYTDSDAEMRFRAIHLTCEEVGRT